ncbi:MAG TPA: endonuclease Q family protein [Thermodesulfovibrionales bacterium]|nr:endonuclease Q family protein [Thermodesulfovibrionales bacterium]
MRFIADLHIHSRYSRATSRDLNPENLWRWSQLKGIAVTGTGDFTHPAWLQELKEKLEPSGNGLYTLTGGFRTQAVPAACRADVSFMLSAEISCIYKKAGRTRKVHAIVLAPGFADAEKINGRLAGVGNLRSDGRPILGLDAKELLRIVLDASPEAMLIPAHAWTPHFSVFGAASGFDSLEECFEDLTPHVYAIETGLSSDPLMNWRLSALDRITLVSNSDAHSPAKLGREANILDTDISYAGIMHALKTGKGFAGTIEFFPEEGKYHNDGHRSCEVSLTPRETLRHNGICPVCGKNLTIGVMHRVEKLADREEGYRPDSRPPFYSIIPLPEIISETLNVGPASRKVDAMYQDLLGSLGNEFRILMEIPLPELEAAGSPRLAEAIAKMRAGDVSIAPGYDGEFGKIRIFERFKKKPAKGQAPLF